MVQVIKKSDSDEEGMDSPMDTEISVTLEEPKKKKQKKFVNAWLQDPLFKEWLKTSPNGDRAFCSICVRDLSCSRSVLVDHVRTQIHIDNYKCLYDRLPTASVDASKAISNVKLNMRSEKVKMELSAFFAEHNLPIAIVDDLIYLLNRLYYDSKLSDKYVKTKKESTKIIVKSSGTEKNLKLSKILRESKFSVLIDESIPITGKKLPCVLVKFMTPDRKILKQCFELTELDGGNYSTSILFAAFKRVFEKQIIPLSNIVSLTSNNALVMFEKRDSFVNRLKEVTPNPVVLNCISGSSSMIASKACAQIPVLCCQFLNSVSLYLSSTSKKIDALQDFQRYFGIEVQKIFKAVTIKWLSLHQCIVGLLKYWIPLICFFRSESMESKNLAAIDIYKSFYNDELHAYLLFLQFTLDIFNEFNDLFRSQEIQIHKLAERSRWILKQMATCFLKPNALDKITGDSLTSENILPLLTINVGGECQKFLDNCVLEIVSKVKSNCLKFYKVATLEIIKRLPYCDEFMSKLQFLNPEIALSKEIRLTFGNLNLLCERFNLMHLVHKINMEWIYVAHVYDDAEIEHLSSLSLENMWSKIFELKHSCGLPVFDNLQKLVDLVLILPHSNAEADFFLKSEKNVNK
ncbi:hypothetical protein PV328_005815 [Microctonus aethiopoides]|uniref:Uncharacterized protein n=1 Tax=Microctonus aethiopoides TaxID=144406 RepID=A0AA39FMS4_9HYME|nr:hypothetical protein PV328_005815 [Microctonus aethiopoides]